MLTLNVMWIASQYGDYGGQLIKMNFGTYNWKKFLVSQTHKITIWALMPAKVELLWYNGEVWVCAQSLSHVQLFVTPRTIACQAPMSIGFSKWEYWSGLPFPPPEHIPKFSSVHFSRSVLSDSLWPHESQHARPPCPSPTPGVHSDSVHRVSDAI